MPPAENLEPVMGRRDSTVINLASHNSLWNFDSKVQLKAHACQSMCLEYLSYRLACERMYTQFDKFLIKHSDVDHIIKENSDPQDQDQLTTCTKIDLDGRSKCTEPFENGYIHGLSIHVIAANQHTNEQHGHHQILGKSGISSAPMAVKFQLGEIDSKEAYNKSRYTPGNEKIFSGFGKFLAPIFEIGKYNDRV